MPRSRQPATLPLVGLLVLVCGAGCFRDVAAPATAPPPPTGHPTPVPTTAPASRQPQPTLEPPPLASLVGAGWSTPGTVGSFAWARGTESAPWLPASTLDAVAARAGEGLTVDMAGELEIESWVGRVAPASDSDGTAARPLGQGGGRPSFAAPAPGAWVVSVQLLFVGGGDATWYWHLVIE